MSILDPREVLLMHELRRMGAYLAPGPQPLPLDHLAKLAGLRFCPDYISDTFQGVTAAGLVTLPVINVKRTIFGSAGANTYTPSKAALFAIVETLGGGGGGGGGAATGVGQAACGGGGGGAESQIAVISSIAQGAHSVTVGAGGAGNFGAAGSAGVASSFTKLAGETGTAPVGLGGGGGFLGGATAPPNVSAQGGFPGNTGTTIFGPTIINVHGEAGEVGFALSNASLVGGAGGSGGGAYGGGGSHNSFGVGNGTPGETWGGGGAGSNQGASGGGLTGGAGATGIVVVFEYIGPS